MREEFDEIRPYEEGEMKQAFEELLADRQFSHLLQGFVPWLPKGLRNGLLRLLFTGIKTPLDFQKRFMKPVVKYIIRKHTDGCSFDDQALPADKTYRYTFLSNHRDIVLDSAFLDVMLDRYRRQPLDISLDQATGAHEQGVHGAPRTDGPRDDALQSADE